MPEYELIYFTAAGRAEPIRLILHYGGIPFKDTRLDSTEWQNWKADSKKIPFGMIPVLHIDGKPLCESHTITRYVAKIAGIDGGPDPIEAAHIDQVYEMCRAFYDATVKYFLSCLGFTQDEKEKVLTPLKKL
uniref:glutathione transferase n=1 Tax=Bursaphelenchus xylophilus TaxID=6326 RepID=A0A1I7RQK3_BURXY